MCPRCQQYHLSGKAESEVAKPSTVVDLAPPNNPMASDSAASDQGAKSGAWSGEGCDLPAPQGVQEGAISSAKKKKRDALALDISWFRERMRDAQRLAAAGRLDECDALLRACVALPKQMHPGTDPTAARRWVDHAVKSHMTWLSQNWISP
jgi:hypothetical protein